MGLTRAFLYAGAKRVIVSLWNVNDGRITERNGASTTAMAAEPDYVRGIARSTGLHVEVKTMERDITGLRCSARMEMNAKLLLPLG